METQESNILFAIKALRSVTRIIKIAPFVYAIVFIMCMMGYAILSDESASILDLMFYVSPIVCATFILLSYPLKLCNWYRLQVCLPMFPLPFTIIDETIWTFDSIAAIVNLSITTLIFLLSLINTYFVFIRKATR